jgi:hypothetical protein
MPGYTSSKLPPTGHFDKTLNSTHTYTAEPMVAHISSTSETDDDPDTESESDSLSNTPHPQERERAWNASRGSRECQANNDIARHIVASMESAVVQCAQKRTTNGSYVDDQAVADHISRYTQLITGNQTWAKSLGLPANSSLYHFEAVAAKKEACVEGSMAVNVVTFRNASGDQVSLGIGPPTDS